MNWKGIFAENLIGIILLVVLLFPGDQNAVAWADERKQAQEGFPSAPPEGICSLAIHDDLGNGAKIALWEENNKSGVSI